MRFHLSYTDPPENARYPAGTVDGPPSKQYTRQGNRFIEITTIEQLLAIEEEFGDLIIGGNATVGYAIEIYNNYRE